MRHYTLGQSALIVVGDKANASEGLLSLDLAPEVRLDTDGEPM